MVNHTEKYLLVADVAAAVDAICIHAFEAVLSIWLSLQHVIMVQHPDISSARSNVLNCNFYVQPITALNILSLIRLNRPLNTKYIHTLVDVSLLATIRQTAVLLFVSFSTGITKSNHLPTLWRSIWPN